MKIYKFDESGYFQIWVKAQKDQNKKIIVPPGYTDKVPPATDEGVRLRFVNDEWVQETVTEAQRTEYEQKIKAEIRRWAINNLIGLEEIPCGYV